MEVNTLIFDLDGTLIDTNELIIETFRRTFLEFYPDNIPSRTEIIEFIGPTLVSTFSKYAINVEDIADLVAYYRKVNRELSSEYIKVFPGVTEALKILQNQKYNLAILTSKQSDVAKENLIFTGLDKFFPVIVGCDHCQNHKPDPEGVYQVLNFFPDHKGALMIGDNDSDILSGKNAGLKTVFVNWSIKELGTPTDYRINTMNELLEIIKES
ncbi:MAG: HAD-IA family hydrolase [Erysipelotrichales bacterium]|nr:HAD-IA family hydrolase [Erysipelotrichales bacterium]